MVASAAAGNWLHLQLDLAFYATIRVGFAAVPVLLGSVWLGPWWGAAIGGAANVVSYILQPLGSFVPTILFVEVLRGFLPGFLKRYVRHYSPTLQLLIQIAVTQVTCSILLTPLVLGLPLLPNLGVQMVTQTIAVLLYLVLLLMALPQLPSDDSPFRSEDRARRQRAAIASLMADDALVAGDVSAALKRVTAVLAGTIGVARASIWWLNEDRTELQCLCLYEAEQRQHSQGTILQADTIPSYFMAVLEESRIYATNALEDARTHDLADVYLKPLGITSLLDTGITIEGRLQGIVSLEHKGGERHWQADEESFASTVASMVAQAFIHDQRRQTEKELREMTKLLRSITDNMFDLVAITDLRGRFKFVGQSHATLGYKPEELLGKDVREFVHPEDLPANEAALRQSFGSQTHGQRVESRYRKADGSYVWIETIAVVLRNDQGKAREVLFNARDITERRQTEHRQMCQHQLALSLSQAETLTDTLRLCLAAAVRATNLQGGAIYLLDETSGCLSLAVDQSLSHALIDYFACMLGQFGLSDRPVYTHTAENGYDSAAASQAHEAIALVPILSNRQRIGFLTMASAATESIPQGDRITLETLASQIGHYIARAKVEEENRYLGFHDNLTGLYNRRFFDTELHRLDVPRSVPITLIMVDVNGLKLVNDAFGHAAGDKLLRKVADGLRMACRSDDIIARIGGDEFAILLPKTGDKQARHLVRRIEEALADARVEAVPISVSCGWGTKVDEEENIHKVFKTAEDNMYRDKVSDRSSHRHESVQLIMQTLYAKTPREQEHSLRMSQLCARIGMSLGLSQPEINELTTASLLHDIGKIAVTNEILNKNGSLSPAERREIERHPEVGYSILSAVTDYAPMAEYVVAHHERWDGGGYPHGLRGEAIPLQARIMAIADAYDAMVSDRPYRRGMSPADALEEIEVCAGSQFDPDVTRVFVQMMTASLCGLPE